MAKNKKLNFDLEFLENVKTKKPEPEAGKENTNSAETTVRHDEQSGTPNNRKNNGWWIIIVVIASISLLIWIGSSYDDSSPQNTSSCDTAKLDSLKPSDYDKTMVENLEADINSSIVNQYSQSSVDAYNAKIDRYNNLKNSYNSKIDAYNNYLNMNCKK